MWTKTLGADIQTKVEELEELNQSLRERDKVKDDAIAQLSNQICTSITYITRGLRENKVSAYLAQ